jgi:general secretion pathway protein D
MGESKMKKYFAWIILIVCLLSSVTASFSETKKPEKVTFNFVDVELSTVTKFISEITGKNFIFDERIKGRITIIAPSRLSVDESYNLFTSVLELKGFTVVPSGVDAYKIIPAAEAKQRGMQIAIERQPVDESYIARLIPFKNISSDDALKFLQPLVSKNGHISTFGPGNLILVVDSGLNIEKILSIIEAIDHPSVKEEPDLVFLKYSSAEAVAKILNEGFGKVKSRAPPGQPSAIEGGKAVGDMRLNAVVLFGEKEIRESMKMLIKTLDVPSPEAQGRINVYFLENTDATELSKVLEGMLRGAQPAKQATTTGAQAAPMTPFEAAGGIAITPDKATNSLVIVASPSDYQNLVQIIKQLDRRRKQVYVEAMIAEVSIDKLLDLGVKWRGALVKDGKPLAIGGFGNIDQTTIQNIITGLAGLSMGGLGRYLTIPGGFLPSTTLPDGTPTTTSDVKAPGFAVLLGLDEFRDAIKILSTPQLLTSDNKEAEIMVGENVPFVTGRQSNIQVTTSVFTTVERQDVGIRLKITPQITEGDYIKLDIYQEISAVKQESATILINVGPTTSKRSTKTSVLVKDRETVVIGGLIQEKEENQWTKMPILGDFPILGWLFKSKSVTKNKTNLLVFITPSVVKDAENLAQITKERQLQMARVTKNYKEGELLVKFKEGVSEEKALSILSKKGASVINYMEDIKAYQIKLKAKQSVEDAIKEFSTFPEVEYAEPNYSLKFQSERKKD